MSLAASTSTLIAYPQPTHDPIGWLPRFHEGEHLSRASPRFTSVFAAWRSGPALASVA